MLIDHLRDRSGRGPAAQLLGLVRDNRVLGYLSVITVAELLVGAQLTGSAAPLRQLLRLFHRKSVTTTIAEHAGAMRAAAMARGREITLLDALIAATAINVRARYLITRNVDDYRNRVGKLAVLTPLEGVRKMAHGSRAQS